MALHAPHSCKKRLIKDLSAHDSAYMTKYQQLLTDPDMAAAKQQLQSGIAALQEQYNSAVEGKDGAEKAQVVKAYADKFRTLKQASPYYQSVQKLREGSDWYSHYQ